MPIGETISPPVPVARKMIWVPAPPDPTPEETGRYVELLEMPHRTVGQQREFSELCGRLGKTPEQAALDVKVIEESDRLNALVAREAEAEAEDLRCQKADRAARTKLTEEVARLLRVLATNAFEECQAANLAREAVRAVGHAKEHLAFLYARFPTLFGLPTGSTEPTAYVNLVPPALRPLMEKAGIRICG
jgi:hypothetical protein